MPDAAVAKQNAPIANKGTAIGILVMKDIALRMEFGKQKYGTVLQAHNGRDALTDAYQEVIDLALYLRQAIEERDGQSETRDTGTIQKS